MRIIGVDYGERRLGFAVCDPDGVFAMPLKVVEVRSGKQAVEAVRCLCEEEEPDEVVVGMPLNMDGSSGPMACKVEEFCSRLAQCVNVPISQWDERLTTSMAERALAEAGADGRRRRGIVDKVAAQNILQGYLDARRTSLPGQPDCEDETVQDRHCV